MSDVEMARVDAALDAWFQGKWSSLSIFVAEDRPILRAQMAKALVAADAVAGAGPQVAARDDVAEINERLTKLVQCLVDENPNDAIADGGHTVLDMWRHDAKNVLADVRVAGSGRDEDAP